MEILHAKPYIEGSMLQKFPMSSPLVMWLDYPPKLSSGEVAESPGDYVACSLFRVQRLSSLIMTIMNSMPRSQWLSNTPYPEPNQPFFALILIEAPFSYCPPIYA